METDNDCESSHKNDIVVDMGLSDSIYKVENEMCVKGVGNGAVKSNDHRPAKPDSYHPAAAFCTTTVCHSSL